MSDKVLNANQLDLHLKQLAQKALQEGIGPRTIMRLLIDQAFEVLNTGDRQSPKYAREHADLVLQEAMLLHSIYDDPGKAV